MPDEELMKEYACGNQNALEELFERYKKPMFNYAFRILNNRADAEDAVGEVFYTLTARKESFRETDAKFSTWLYTIARNVCVTRLRRRKRVVFLWHQREESGTYEQIDLPDERPRADEHAEDGDLAACVRGALFRLPELQRQAIVLREYQGCTYEEIAQILVVSLAQVKTLIFRARMRLKETLSFLLKGEL